jgi:mycofactocin precursor
MTLSITQDTPTDQDTAGVVAGVDPAPEPVWTDAAPLIEEDLLVEDVSIDGMCGVY